MAYLSKTYFSAEQFSKAANLGSKHKTGVDTFDCVPSVTGKVK